MSARIYCLPGGERNGALVAMRRRNVLARPDIQEQIANLGHLLTTYHANKLLTKTSELPGQERKPRLRLTD